MESSLLTVVLAILAIPVCGYLGWRTWHGWMGRDPHEAEKIWGPNLWPAIMRAMPVGAAMFALGCLALLAITLVPDSEGAFGVRWQSSVATPFGVGTSVAFVLWLSILVTNRPKWLVPPMHRSEKTAWAGWCADRRKKRVR
jgi:hypothetical protein